MALERINGSAYQQLSSMDSDQAGLVLSSLLYDTMGRYITKNYYEIQKSVDQWVAKRFVAVDRYAKRTYLSQVSKGESTEEIENFYSMISKARTTQNTEWWTANTAEAERLHPRDERGRWKLSPYKIVRPFNKDTPPIRNPVAAGLPNWTAPGRAHKPQGMDRAPSDEHKAAFQSAYAQIKATLEMYTNAGLGGDAQVRITGSQGGGTKVVQGTADADIDDALAQFARAGKLPSDFVVAVPAEVTVGGAYFDALSAIPGVDPSRATAVMSGTTALPGAIGSESDFANSWYNSTYALSDNEPRFGRLKAGADLADALTPSYAVKTKAALLGAKYLGELGPDAEKLIGPTARKLSYRSRGKKACGQ